MANIQSISHKKSSVIENGAPKLPTAAQLELGELAINFADGYETLSIKNNNNEIVTFTNDEYWVNKERVIAAALTDLDQRITEVSEDVADIPEQVQADWNLTVTTAADYIKNKPTISINVVEDDTNPVSGGAVYSYITEIEQVTASALNDLDGRTTLLSDDVEDLADQISEISVELSSNYETSSDTGGDLDLEPGDDLDTLAGKLEKSIEETLRVTSYALNELSERIPNLELSDDYAPSSDSNDDLELEAGDTYEEAFGKLEKAIVDNELVTATALTDLNTNKQDILVSGTNIKTVNNLSLLGSGNINILEGDVNIIETVKVNGTALTPDANKAVNVIIPVEEFNHNLYYKKDNNKYYPVSNPDISTQPSMLPYRFGLYNMFEVLMPVYGLQNVVEGDKVSDEYVIRYEDEDESFLIFRPGDIIFDNSVILEAHLIGNNVYSSVSISKEINYYKVYSSVPIGKYKGDFNYLYIKYYNNMYNGYDWKKTNYTYDFADYYAMQYLTIESLEDNNIIKFITVDDAPDSVVYASTDGGLTFTLYTSSLNDGTLVATLNTGDKLLLKSSGFSRYAGNKFSMSKPYNLSGNIMSLLYNDDFIAETTLLNPYQFDNMFSNTPVVDASNLILPAITLTNFCYQHMFLNCTLLTDGPKILPANTLTGNCYFGMFDGCTNLVGAPELPAKTLSNMCYAYMFSDCVNLTDAPELPATNLANNCYEQMFLGCESLETAPVLPASTLRADCYKQMFSNCVKLNHIECLATSQNTGTSTTQDWVYHVAATGTFIKAASMGNWTTGNNGVPTGWTIESKS